MLHVFDQLGKKLGMFNDYGSLLSFIEDQERSKPVGGSSYEEGHWAFACYTPKKVREICTTTKPEYLTHFQLKALKQSSGLLEICHGDYSRKRQIPIVGDVDVASFKKKFCDDYCEFKKWRALEVLAPRSSGKKMGLSPTNGHSYACTRRDLLLKKPLPEKDTLCLKESIDSCIERLKKNRKNEPQSNLQEGE